MARLVLVLLDKRSLPSSRMQQVFRIDKHKRRARARWARLDSSELHNIWDSLFRSLRSKNSHTLSLQNSEMDLPITAGDSHIVSDMSHSFLQFALSIISEGDQPQIGAFFHWIDNRVPRGFMGVDIDLQWDRAWTWQKEPPAAERPPRHAVPNQRSGNRSSCQSDCRMQLWCLWIQNLLGFSHSRTSPGLLQIVLSPSLTIIAPEGWPVSEAVTACVSYESKWN